MTAPSHPLHGSHHPLAQAAIQLLTGARATWLLCKGYLLLGHPAGSRLLPQQMAPAQTRGASSGICLLLCHPASSRLLFQQNAPAQARGASSGSNCSRQMPALTMLPSGLHIFWTAEAMDMTVGLLACSVPPSAIHTASPQHGLGPSRPEMHQEGPCALCLPATTTAQDHLTKPAMTPTHHARLLGYHQRRCSSQHPEGFVPLLVVSTGPWKL